MTQHVKKKPLAVFHDLEEAGKKLMEVKQEDMENALRATESLNRAASECMAACSDNICAYIESGSNAVHSTQNIGTELIECCNRAFADLAELSKGAAGCRSLDDIVRVQNEYIRHASDNYFNTVNQLAGKYFDFYSQALAPLGERAASATKHMRRIFSA